MGTTPIYGLPYLDDGDPPDIPLDGQTSMTAVEAELARIDTDVAEDPWGGAVSVQVDESTDHANITATTYTAGTVNCQTTFIAPPSGKVLVHVAGNGGGTTTSRVLVSFEIRQTNVAGLVITPAVDENGVMLDCVSGAQQAMPTLVSSLTPGATYYIRAMHKTLPSGTTGDLYFRRICVTPTV